MEIITLLKMKRDRLSVIQLTKALGVERSRVSHSLQMLKQCNLIVGEKQGRKILYSLNKSSPIFADNKDNKDDAGLFVMVESHANSCCSFCQKQQSAPRFTR